MIQRPTTSPLQIAFHQLALIAYFFAMRSCEYLKTSGDDRKTKPLRLRNLVFRDRRNRIIPHDSPNLHLAKTITIAFEFQKKDLRDDSVTQSWSGHPLCCPVLAAAAIVRRLRSFSSDPDTFLYSYLDSQGITGSITSTTALKLLRGFIDTIEPEFGIASADVGLHSIRASAAMGMYLNQVPVYAIMLLGRWSSDAFLRYIRKQVTEFSNNVSRQMIRNATYYQVPDHQPVNHRTHRTSSTTASHHMGTNGAGSSHSVFSVWA